MLLPNRYGLSPLPSLLSPTQPVLRTYLILIVLLFSTPVLTQNDSVTLNSSSLMTIPNSTWDLRTTKEIAFRTCSDSGNLISINGSLNSSSSSSNSQELAVLLHNSSVVFVWSINGHHGTVYVGKNVNNNSWYTARLKYLLNEIQFSVSIAPNSALDSVVVANSNNNTFLLDVRLSGTLKIGEGFTGCLHQGLGVNFTASGITTQNIGWDPCPLTARTQCTNIAQNTKNCYRFPCQHGATCVDGVNNYTCVCPPNFNGTNCENDLAALYGCDVQPCLNQGTCRNQTGTSPRKFTCACSEGFTGSICESTIDLCLTYPCEQGTCHSLVNNYTCDCSNTGYSGTNCTVDINECRNTTICGSSSCNNLPGGFSCACPTGYDGISCKELNECLSLPCQHGGNCTDLINAFACTCVPGYTGLMCESDINECESQPCTLPNTTCLNLLNHRQCVCMEGYSGSPCQDIDECALNTCKNNVICSNTLGSYNCTCLPGFTGKNCSVAIDFCQPNPCFNSSTCSAGVNDYNCSCLPGFTGKTCHDDINECEGQVCQNNGTCINQVNGFKCDCRPGMTGVYCETDIDECLNNPCLNGAKCTNLHYSYNCTCLPKFEGINCSIYIDDCSRIKPCQNGGECFNGVQDYSCNCTSDRMGRNCTEEYDACFFEPCLHGANCTTVPPNHEYTCTCKSGFTGGNCEIDINDCVGNNCSFYQMCYDRINSYDCGCPVGYTGGMCETEVDECLTNPCQNNASCTNGHGDYTCSCHQKYINLSLPSGQNVSFLSGYSGKNCQQDINECEEYNNPPICQAQGICMDVPKGSFTCYCKSGEEELHTGTLCEQVRSYCNIRLPSEACQNGGTCRDVFLSFTCDCVEGFTGRYCEEDIDECASSPCQYSGTCEDHVNGYVCTCIDGINGTNCEFDINDCQPDPCRHGGVCQDHINNFTCDCSGTGYNGTTCENNIDDCDGHKCQHGGLCNDGINEYTCNCLAGYNGSRCEWDIPECSPNPCFFNSTCLEYSNVSLYDKGNPHFVNFTFSNASGYWCDCVSGVKGVNCFEDVDECESTPCENNATCENFNTTGFKCHCMLGYEGHLCGNETNECTLYRPCKNGGSCIDKLADYDCVCPTPLASRQNYGGKNCTTYLRGCDGPRQCINGDCIPMLIDQVHLFKCDCHPGYAGRVCSESTDMSFRGQQNNFIMSQMNASEFDINLRFRTTVSNASLVLWKLSANVYVSVELSNGRVHVIYRANSIHLSCTLNTLSAVNNSEYHQLKLVIAHNLTLALPLDRCTDTACSSRDCQMSLPVGGDQSQPVSQVYIGSETLADIQDKVIPASFVGCMEDVMISGNLYYPGRQIGHYSGVSPGCSRTQQCAKDSCSGHGFCEDLWDTYTCHCYRPYYGVECENEYQSATFGLNPGSLATYTNVPANKDYCSFSFFMITRQENGSILIFGNGEFAVPKRNAYVGLYISNGQLSGDFFKCGYAKHFDTARHISDGQKHFVSINIQPKMFEVMLNSELVFRDGNVTDSDKVCSPEYGFRATIVTIGKVEVINVSRRKRDVHWWDFEDEIAGIPEMSYRRDKRQAVTGSLPPIYQSLPGFQGVIQDVQVGGAQLSFSDANFKLPVLVNVTIGANSTSDVCRDGLCENGNNCTNAFYNDFTCICLKGFRGKNCSLVDYCNFGTCPSESTCQNLQYGHECISTASFNTDSSLIAYAILGDVPEPVLTFDFRTRGLYGLIFLLRKGDHYFKIRVANGQLEMNWKVSSNFSVTMVTILKKRVNDGQWYSARFEFINGTYIRLQVLQESVLIDDTPDVRLAVANFSFEDMLKNGEVVLGNIAREMSSPQWEVGYRGCLREVRMGGLLLPFFRDGTFQNNTATNRFLAERVENIVNNCAGKDACAGHSCLNGGSCVDLWNDHRCNCPAGLEGLMCEDNPDNCASNPCMNGGVCVDGLATFSCTCPKGFTGEICQTDQDLCNANNSALCENNSRCLDLGSDFKCICTDPEFVGWFCNITVRQSCSENLCQNGGRCNNTITLVADTNVSSFNCSCENGYEGVVCEKVIDYCSPGPMCENNGECVSQPGNQSYKCHCNESLGYTGENCSKQIDNCVDSFCNNGTCFSGFKNYTCLCNEGYTGPICVTKVIDDCQNMSLCQHGTCSDGFCNCTYSRWSGNSCEIEVDECNSTDPVCHHGGICTNLEGSYYCNCSLGYEELQCDTPNCGNFCDNEGKCRINSNSTDWYCQCPDYVQGALCNETGPCFHKPCEHSKNGSCIQSIPFNNYTCICDDGWTGINCTDDQNECVLNSSLCGNGNCTNTNGSYVCECQAGYTGQNCGTNINECEPNPCENNGICTDQINSYICNCSGRGYEGLNCSKNIDECQNLTICNHGNCIDLPGSYHCNCTDRYVGIHCEVDDPCYNNTMCHNGGACESNQTESGGFNTHCLCTTGFEGVTCEKQQSRSDKKGPDLGVIIGPIVGGVVLIILIIVIIAFVMTARSKRATRGAYSPSQQETSGSRVEMGNVLKKPPEERLI